MVRFSMPPAYLDKETRIRQLNSQFEEFLDSDILREYLDVLGVTSTDPAAVHAELQQYNTRQTEDGGKLESQDAPKHRVLEDKKAELFPYYCELGLVTINTPKADDYDHIVMLGGSANSNFDKTMAASGFLNPDVRDVSALACYRPVQPEDRENTKKNHNAADFDTEAGSFVSAYNKIFSLTEHLDEEVFCFKRNINTACGIRFFYDDHGTSFRVLAAPGEEPVYRADTYDTCLYYLDNLPNKDAAKKILVITNNQYSNYQFITFAMAVLERDRNNMDFEIIGCSPDDRLATAKNYNTNQYLVDIIAMIDWIIRFRKRFVYQE